MPQAAPQAEATVWESLALGNLMVALATARHYAYQSLGALGVAELTAPRSKQFVQAGLLRLGLSIDTPDYYSSSTRFDALHSAAWQREVVEPLVAADSTLAPLIAEGALMRLECAARCFERYRDELWSPARRLASFEYADGPARPNEPAHATLATLAEPAAARGEAQPNCEGVATSDAPLGRNVELRSWSVEAIPFQPSNRGSKSRSEPAFRSVSWPEVSRRVH